MAPSRRVLSSDRGIPMRTCVLGLFLAMYTVFAAAKDDEERFPKAETPQAFEVLVGKIHEQLAAGGRFEFVKATDRQELDRRFGVMAALLEKAGSVDAMAEKDRFALFNEQEHVNDILTRGDGERLVCESVAPVGSHIPVRKCRTYSEIARSRQSTETFTHSVWSQNHCDPNGVCHPVGGSQGH